MNSCSVGTAFSVSGKLQKVGNLRERIRSLMKSHGTPPQYRGIVKIV